MWHTFRIISLSRSNWKIKLRYGPMRAHAKTNRIISPRLPWSDRTHFRDKIKCKMIVCVTQKFKSATIIFFCRGNNFHFLNQLIWIRHKNCGAHFTGFAYSISVYHRWIHACWYVYGEHILHYSICDDHNSFQLEISNAHQHRINCSYRNIIIV